MQTYTYKIEMRVTLDTEEQHQIMLDVVREMARQGAANAALLSNKRKPDICIEAGDYFAGREEIEMFGVNDG